MPQTALVIPETVESISRPVAHAILFQLSQLLKFPNNTQLIFPGGTETIPQTGSTLGYRGAATNFNSNSRLSIELIENFVEDTSLTTAVFKKDYPFIFNDPELNIKITPIYNSVELIFNMTYVAPSKVAAEQYRDYVKLKANELRQVYMHEVDYHYSLPTQYINLLYELWKMREAVDGYGDTFSEYVQQYLTKKATNISTQIGTQTQIAIREHQINIVGWFEFDVYPEKTEKSGDNGNFELKFSYKVNYDKVTACRCEYPLVVHNQLIPDIWHGNLLASGDIVNDPYVYKYNSSSTSTNNFHYFSELFKLDKNNKNVSIPAFDDWVPNFIKPETITLVDCMLMVDTSNVRFLLNLKDLGDYVFDPLVIDYLTKEYSYLNKYGQSFIYIQLFLENNYVSDDLIFIDNELNVFTTFDLNLRSRYHLKISIISNFNILSNFALEKFRSYGQSALTLISGLQSLVLNKVDPPVLLANKYIKKIDIEKINIQLNPRRINGTQELFYNQRSVGYFLIKISGEN